MGKAIWIVIALAVVAGGYFGYTKVFGGGVQSYQTEKLAEKVCNTIMRAINTDGKPVDQAVEIGRKEFKETAKDRVGMAFADADFNFGVEGKTCKGAIVLRVGDSEEVVRVKKDY